MPEERPHLLEAVVLLEDIHRQAVPEIVRLELRDADLEPRHRLGRPRGRRRLRAVYRSLGIGADRPSQYQKVWRAAMKG